MAGHASIYCPHCHKHTALTPAPVAYKCDYDELTTGAYWRKSDRLVWWIGICNACFDPVLVLNDAITVYPTPRPTPTDPSIPEGIRADLNEAKQCFSVGAYRGCSVMARRAMQSTALDKGATGATLVTQIDDLATTGKITADLKEWAHAVRWVGNDAAHPGGGAVDKDDASDVLQLAEQFLHVVYVAPALAAGIRKKLGKSR